MTTARPRRTATVLALALAASAAGVLAPSAPAGAAPTFPVTTRISKTPNGSGIEEARVLVDATGRLVFFTSSDELVADDTNNTRDVYVRDRLSGDTTRVSLADDDTETAGNNALCGISRNGRYVGFEGRGANLPGGLTQHLYLRDRQAGTTAIVDISGLNVANATYSSIPTCDVSDDGRFVAFASTATNLGSDADAIEDVFERDMTAKLTKLMSRNAAGDSTDKASTNPSINDSGSFVVFESDATNLVAGDTNGDRDIYLRSFDSTTTARVSVGPGQEQLDGPSSSPDLSDGRYVVFETEASNAVLGGDDTVFSDIVRRDRNSGTNEYVSKASNGSQSNGISYLPFISSNGRYVSFQSSATNLYAADSNSKYDVFRRDMDLGQTLPVSRVHGSIVMGDKDSVAGGVSDDGRVVGFSSRASNLVPGDEPNSNDAFVRAFSVSVVPFDSTTKWITQQYADFAERAPTATELGTWKGLIDTGAASPEQLVDGLAHSTAYAGRRAPVTRLYWSFFLRMPDKGGLEFWMSKLAEGKSLQWVASQFAKSPEFQATYGALSTGAFVELIYQNILEREAEPGGLAFWTAQLDAGAKTRGDVMVSFSESAEGRRFLAPRVDTVLIHLGMLRTMPSPFAFATGVLTLQTGEPPERLADAYADSAAYLARFT